MQKLSEDVIKKDSNTINTHNVNNKKLNQPGQRHKMPDRRKGYIQKASIVMSIKSTFTLVNMMMEE